MGGSYDLKIWHTGNHAYIKNTTGVLHIQGNNSNDLKVSPRDDEDSIILKNNGAVELYYDNALKLHTHADGVKLNDLSLIHISEPTRPY